MSNKEMERRVSAIAEAVAGLKYCEWCRIRTAIDKKFSSVSSKIKLEDAEELKRAIQIDF